MASQRFGFAHSLALLIISFCLLPINSYILLCSFALQVLLPRRKQPFPAPIFRRRKVVISGVNTANGLILARAFHQAGHYVIGTDCQINWVPGIGRVSRALRKYYTLPTPKDGLATTEYVHGLLRVVEKEEAELWISCSAFTSPIGDSLAREIIQRKTNCRCVSLDMEQTSTLSDKHQFLQYASSVGLPSPKTYSVTSRTEVHKVLSAAAPSDQSFTISKVRSRQVAADDSLRLPRDTSPVLPRRSLSETYQAVAEISISPDKPYVLEEDVTGEEYITHSVVVRGSVETFAACLALKPSMHIRGLAPGSGLHESMLKFTQEFVSKYEQELTGSLSFKFKIRESSSEKGYSNRLIPIACNPEVEAPSILLQHESRALSQAILSILDEPTSNGYLKQSKKLVTATQHLNYHWSGQDLLLLLVLPMLNFLNGRIDTSELFGAWYLFFRNAITWKDVTFELWDPLPWFWQYHVYWPLQMLLCIVHRRTWSILDVSTGQIYE
ncbi:hypothetical protein MMC10_005136 [Thelotrema lepadinum]|nr:hypothetical protein [Thelotrema lepadinum]